MAKNCNCGTHPHTVGDPGVPLYLRGFSLLGQDGSTVDPSAYDSVPPAIDPSISLDTSALFPATDSSLQPLIDSGFSPSDAATISDLASKGWLSQTDWNDLMAGNVTPSELASINYGASAAQDAAAAANAVKAGATIATSVVKAATPSKTQAVALPPGSSPRVNVAPAVAPGASVGSWFTGSTSIGGAAVPNLLLIGAPVLIALAFMGGGSSGGRRR